MRLLIWGACDFAAEILDIARPSGAYSEYALLDDKVAVGTLVHGVAVVGDRNILGQIDPASTELFLAIGTPKVRQSVYKVGLAHGFRFPTLIDPTAVVRDSAQVGAGSYIGVHSLVSSNSRVGPQVIVSPSSVVGHDTVVGQCSFIGPGARLLGGSQVGDCVTVGANASILNWVKVGDGATVAMAAAVFRDVDPDVLVAGNPARQMR